MTHLDPADNLPVNANLNQYRKQAKELLKDFRANQSHAISRFGVHHPRYKDLLTRELIKVDIKLADAQVVISAELGFLQWASLCDAIEGQPETQISIPNDRNERELAFHQTGLDGNARLVGELLRHDPSLVDCRDDNGQILLEALPTQEPVCAGLSPSRVTIYGALKNAGARPSMVAAIRANDLDAVVEYLRVDPQCAIAHPTGNTPISPDDNVEISSPWQSNFVMAADNGQLAIVNRMLETASIPDAHVRAAIDRTLLSNNFEIAQRLLDTGVDYEFNIDGNAEFQNPVGLQWELEHGADPNAHDGRPLTTLLNTYGRKTGPKHECIQLLIDHGVDWTDDPVMAIHRGNVSRLAEFLDADSALIQRRVSLGYGVHMTLRDVTLLHVAVEYNERECVDLLLSRGADLNATAGYEPSGIGGQTPIFHAIGGNQGLLFPLFRHLMSAGPTLNANARIQYDPLYAQPARIEDLTPLAYARRYANGPGWRQSNRETAVIEAAMAARED